MKKLILYMGMLLCCSRFAGAQWSLHLFANTPGSLQPSIQGGVPPYTAISRGGKFVILPAYDAQDRLHSLLVGPNLGGAMQDLNLAAGPTPTQYYPGGFSLVNDFGETTAHYGSELDFYRYWNHGLLPVPASPTDTRISELSFLDDNDYMYGQAYYNQGPNYGDQAIVIAQEPNSVLLCDSLLAYGNTGTPFLTDVSASGTDVGEWTDNNYNTHGFFGHNNSFTIIDPPAGFESALPTTINDAGAIAGVLTTGQFGQGEVFVLQGGIYTVIPPLGAGNFVDIEDFTSGICRVDSVDIDRLGNVFFPVRSGDDYADVTYNYWNAATKTVVSLDSEIAPLLPANEGYTIDGMDENGTIYGAYIYNSVPSSSPYGEPTNYYSYFYVNPSQAVPLSSLTFSPSPVVFGNSTTGTVTLAAPAPAAGLTVALSSATVGLTLPTSVNVPPGSTSTTFSVTPADYDANYTANVKATDGFFSVAGAFTVDTITLTSISASPNPISAGAGSTGTVYISQPAPAAGWTVNLSSSTSYVGVPSSVVIPPGQQSKTFPITTADYYVNYAASIKATDSVSSKSTTLNVTCTYLTSVSASPNPVGAGDACTGTVNISQPAPTGGWTVNLSSSTSYAGVPSSVVVPAGSTSATFPIVTTNYYENFNATIKATDSVSTVSTALTVDSLYISSLSLSPTSVANGTPSQGTVTLNGVAPAGGWTIQLVSSEPGYASVPASILIPAGSSSATFTVTTGLATVKFIQNVSITASYLVSSKSASLELTP